MFVLIPWCPSNSMEQNPTLEADNHSATQEVLRLLFNHKVHYRTKFLPSSNVYTL